MIVQYVCALMLLQFAASTATDAPSPEARYFHYERKISIPLSSNGQACAVLDADVFAHAATQAWDDLRLYGNDGKEVPFTITESGSARVSVEQADVRNAGMRGDDIVFDLHMPNRPYTAVQLDLDARDFVATAKVSGTNGDEAPVQLGTFVLFDFTSQHLSRSITLPLQESSFHDLHVSVHIVPSPGSASQHFTAAIVRGATVPPSREAQTLYTTVAGSNSFMQRGQESVATVHVPAHVPVERFSFDLDPSFEKDFLRKVSITARPDNAQDTASLEVVPGEISHQTLPADVTGFVPNESLNQRSIDAVLGADLRKGATVEIAVQNGNDTPLPLRGVQLQMRQRRICFHANSVNASYTLMYGDEALKAPVYDYARLFTQARNPIAAELEPEQVNASFQARQDERPYSERHPEVLWVALIAAVAALGTVAMRNARRQH